MPFAIGPKNAFQLNQYCHQWKEKKSDSCPRDLVIKQHILYLENKEKNKEFPLTRILTFSIEPSATTHNQMASDKSLNVIDEMNKLCSEELDKITDYSKKDSYCQNLGFYNELPSERPKLDKIFEDLKNPKNRKKQKSTLGADNVYESSFLNGLYSKTCPFVDSWVSEYSQRKINPDITDGFKQNEEDKKIAKDNHDKIQTTLNNLFKSYSEVYAPLSSEEKEKLSVLGCSVTEIVRRKPNETEAKGVMDTGETLNKGLIYYRFKKTVPKKNEPNEVHTSKGAVSSLFLSGSLTQ